MRWEGGGILRPSAYADVYEVIAITDCLYVGLVQEIGKKIIISAPARLISYIGSLVSQTVEIVKITVGSKGFTCMNSGISKRGSF